MGVACAHPRGAISVKVATTEPAPEHPAPNCLVPPGLPASELIRQHGTVLDAYQLEGGVWLDGMPVLVNEDFDFALATGMEGGVGAGLASAKRKQSNAQKAAALSALPAPPELQRRLEELRCCGTHVYFLLWGAESAVLRTVADVPGDLATSRVIESPSRPMSGDSGWAAEGVLPAQAQQSIEGLDCEARTTVQTGAMKGVRKVAGGAVEMTPSRLF
jgi:hypothetical protein